MPEIPSAKSSATAAKSNMPGEVVRGLVSLFLIIHLLGIGLGLATNSGWPTSELLARLKRVPILDQYIYAMWLDVGYNYPLYRDISDSDHSVVVKAVFPDGRQEVVLEFPSKADGGETLERYLAFARRTAIPAYYEGANNSPMMAAVGKAILNRKDLKEAGVKEVIFETTRHTPLELSDMRSSDAKQRDPFHERTYARARTAIVTLSRSGAPQVTIPGEARDVAPVTPGASSPAQPGTGLRRTRNVPLPPVKDDPNAPSKLSLPPSLEGLEGKQEQPRQP